MVTALLIVLAAVFNVVMDKSSENKFKSVYWNKDEGWVYKWKDATATEERFLGSSTVFVFLTDGWHLTQFLFHSSWQLALSIHINMEVHWLLEFILIKTLFSAVFELFYRKWR